MRNFESIKSTKPRLSDEAAAIAIARKGKRNKPVRYARTEWENGEHHKTNVGAQRRYLGEEML